MKMSLQTKIVKSVRALSGVEIDEAIRLSKEAYSFIQPLMDWYQFTSRDSLCSYLEEIFDRSEFEVTYNQARYLASGRVKYELDDSLKWLHSTMRRMHEAAIGGGRVHIDKGLRRKYILPNDKPLHELVIGAVKEFTGEETKEAVTQAVASIEQILEDANKVSKPAGLVQKISRNYGFANPQKTQEFLADAANIPLNYKMLNLTGTHKEPSNYHRKMFAVALALDYSWENGFKNNAIDAILKRGRERSAKEGHTIYLPVSRYTYDILLKKFEAKGIRDHILAVVLSQVLGISLYNAKNDYIPRKNKVMDFDYYHKLEEFVGYALPNIDVVELSDKKKRQSELDKFLKEYKGGRVIVAYDGHEDIEVNGMVKVISLEARKKLGLSFLYDPKSTIKVPGFRDCKDVLMDSKYYRPLQT